MALYTKRMLNVIYTISEQIGLLIMSNLQHSTKEILIIANGSSNLNYQYGYEIDSFYNVARINNYSTKGYEICVGSKTDIWFNGANQGLKKRVDIPKQVIVFVPAEILLEKGEKIHKRIEKRIGLKRQNYKLNSYDEMINYENIIGASRPTTGTSAILWAIDNFNKVIIHGFDFFVDSKTHYNDNPIMRWLIEKKIIKKATKHNMQEEKKYIESLITSEKVILLKDYLK